jgi:hypothetical protein
MREGMLAKRHRPTTIAPTAIPVMAPVEKYNCPGKGGGPLALGELELSDFGYIACTFDGWRSENILWLTEKVDSS